MKPMECSHDRLRTVGDRVFCCACGEELPLSFLTQDGQKKEDTAKSTIVKKTAKTAEKASDNAVRHGIKQIAQNPGGLVISKKAMILIQLILYQQLRSVYHREQ